MGERTKDDYVFVGAGSAGCVLANRLTQDLDTTVLLLEAGGPEGRREIRIPVAFPKSYLRVPATGPTRPKNGLSSMARAAGWVDLTRCVLRGFGTR